MTEDAVEKNTKRLVLRPENTGRRERVGPLKFSHQYDVLMIEGDCLEQALRYRFGDLMSSNLVRLHDDRGQDLPIPVAASCDGAVVNLTIGGAATSVQRILRGFVDNPWEFELDPRRVLPPCCHPTIPHYSVRYYDGCVSFEPGYPRSGAELLTFLVESAM